MNDVRKPWGRWATLGLAVVALLVGQLAGLAALAVYYGASLGRLPDFSGDGVAISLIIFVSTPIEVALLILFAQWRGASWADYLGYTLPRKADVIIGVSAVIGLIVVGNLVSWVLGRIIVTPFQLNIYRTAEASGSLPLLWLWLGVVVATPIGEESLFRGFLFRGWLTGPRDAWPVILVTAALWAVIHVQYDWYVIAQVFAFGVLLGWLRWASGSTLLTMLLHALINFEGMLETAIDLKWFN
ncbi:MAG TPA: type II CAAX endopeptidase family protein [Pseudolabrys sp.]|nr:type II CAAX endopeptidase family protein [Pseudolabrys sp.]